MHSPGRGDGKQNMDEAPASACRLLEGGVLGGQLGAPRRFSYCRVMLPSTLEHQMRIIECLLSRTVTEH